MFVFMLSSIGVAIIVVLPVMLAAIAIFFDTSGISIVGALLIAGSGQSTTLTVIGFVAVVLATINVVGGFLVTDRMLQMFKRRTEPQPGPGGEDAEAG